MMSKSCRRCATDRKAPWVATSPCHVEATLTDSQTERRRSRTWIRRLPAASAESEHRNGAGKIQHTSRQSRSRCSSGCPADTGRRARQTPLQPKPRDARRSRTRSLAKRMPNYQRHHHLLSSCHLKQQERHRRLCINNEKDTADCYRALTKHICKSTNQSVSV